MVILDEVLQQVHALLRLYLIDFDQILSDTQSQSINQSIIERWMYEVIDPCSLWRQSGLYLTHLQLEQPPFFLHLFSDLSASDLRPDHPVLFSVFSLLLLDL